MVQNTIAQYEKSKNALIEVRDDRIGSKKSVETEMGKPENLIFRGALKEIQLLKTCDTFGIVPTLF